MRTNLNLALQNGAVLAFAVLRLTAPGWLLIALIFSGAGLLLLGPSALALAVRRRQRLPRALSVPFVACAGSLLLAGSTMPDFGDSADSEVSPVLVVAGIDGPVPAVLSTLGTVGVACWAGSLMWLLVALAVVSRPPTSPPGPPHPSWRS